MSRYIRKIFQQAKPKAGLKGAPSGLEGIPSGRGRVTELGWVLWFAVGGFGYVRGDLLEDEFADEIGDRICACARQTVEQDQGSSAIGSGDSRMRPAARRYATTLNDSSSRISERSARRSSWSASSPLRGNVWGIPR